MQNSLSRALPWLARMVARQCGIEVRFDERARTAYITADRVVVLPLMPNGDELSASLALGYTVHEAFHASYTDFEVADSVTSSPENSLFQLFEDARIETLGMRAFPGAAGYLRRAWEIMYERGLCRRPTGQPIKPVVDVFALALAHCRSSCLALDAARHDVPLAREVIVSQFGEDAAQRLESIIAKAPAGVSTSDSLALAQAAMQVIYEVTGQQPPTQAGKAPSQDPQPAEAGEPASGEKGSPPAPATPSPPGSSASAVDAGGAPPPEGGDTRGEQSPTGAAEPGSPQEPSMPWRDDPHFVQEAQEQLEQVVGDAGHAIQVLLPEVIEAAVEADRASGSSPLMLGAAHLVEPADSDLASPRLAEELLLRTSASTSATRAVIRHLLVSLTDQDTRYARRGRVKATRLWRLRTGCQNVFEHTDEAVELDTAVTVLLDTSLSMRGNKLRLAVEAVTAVALAIDGVAGITTSVCAFPGPTSQKVVRLKRFSESAQRATARLAGLGADGGTPLAEALYPVAEELASQTAHGHLLIVVTDGEPDCVSRARLALADIEHEGVDMIGVGIGCDVSHLFERSVELRNQNELAPKLFEILTERFREYAAAAA